MSERAGPALTLGLLLGLLVSLAYGRLDPAQVTALVAWGGAGAAVGWQYGGALQGFARRLRGRFPGKRAVTAGLAALAASGLLALWLPDLWPAAALLAAAGFLGLLLGDPARSSQAVHGSAAGEIILDTNVLIDGRILELYRLELLGEPSLVTDGVLRELQHLADHAEPSRRQRGRRGLETAQRLQELGRLRTLDWAPAGAAAVDDQLLLLAKSRAARLATIDQQLARVAALSGVRVLNLQEIALALRSQLQPGDRLLVHVSKAGTQAGQGVAYLENGTMVIVENGWPAEQDPLPVILTRQLQTAAGRVVFARKERD